MRSKRVSSLVFGIVVTSALSANGASLLELSGNVAFADGVAPQGTRVKLGVDLNRDDEIQSFESLNGTVAPDGSYRLSYELDSSDVDLEFVVYVTEVLAEYQAGGFDALIAEGALPLIVTIEREGYSTVTRRLSSLLDNPRLDAWLTPLERVGCADGTCRTGSGDVEISGFPGGTGIDRAFASGYDPAQDFSRFPGAFSDSSGNLLVSSGFLEIDLRDSSGNRVHELPAPVNVRFEPNPTSWKTLRDLAANSSRIEVPMYSFDEVKGQWVAEPDGVLEDENGELIAESRFAAIKSGSYSGRVFITFSTQHFSTFNCDEPVEARACVKGRLVTDGQPLVGISVSANGVSYTGSAGTLTTGVDGAFAADVMKSEAAGEDVDANGQQGETFTARVVAASELGVFLGTAFDTPAAQGSVGGDVANCQPQDCDCVDLGDLEVTFEMPRACEITVHATYSGMSVGAEADLVEGDALEGATLRGELEGDISLPVSATVEACSEATSCNSATTDSNGSATFVVPVVGDAPDIKLHAERYATVDGVLHAYCGELTVTGCARGQTTLDVTAEIETDHAASGDMGDFIDSLGDWESSEGNGTSNPLASGCGCSHVGVPRQPAALLLSFVGALGVLLRRGNRISRRRSFAD